MKLTSSIAGFAIVVLFAGCGGGEGDSAANGAPTGGCRRAFAD